MCGMCEEERKRGGEWRRRRVEEEEGKDEEKEVEGALCLEFFLLGICSSTLLQGCSGGLVGEGRKENGGRREEGRRGGAHWTKD